MSDQPSVSLVNLGPLSKPVDTFIKKVSDFVGGAVEPYQIKRIAKARAEAALINAESEIHISDLQIRAAQRWLKEEEAHQRNMEEITSKAIPLLKDDADPSAMEDDWIANFFAKSRIVSDKEMQGLWGRILAGEANAPGIFSKGTINILSGLDKVDADLFTKLCGFSWTIDTDRVPLVFHEQAELYNNRGINFATLSHLDSIGLVQFRVNGLGEPFRAAGFDMVVESSTIKLQGESLVHYYGRPLPLNLNKDADASIGIGYALFTRAGEELARICESRPVEGFYEYVKEHWKQHLPEVETSEEDKIEAGYEILDELVGFVESDSTDGSVNHDDLIYEMRSKP